MTTPWYRDGALHFGVGIEDTFVPQERPGERAIDEYALTEHDIRWHDDLALAAEVGADFVRWGVPWYRVQPEPGRFDWSWLDRVFARFAELGIRPIVDLMHYGTPLWMPGQFDDADYPQRVAEYSVQVAERYADTVTDYTPLNEPMIHALFSGEYAYWPPYLAGEAGLVRMVDQLARGFALAQLGMRDVLGGRGTFVHVDAGMRYAGDLDAPEHRELAHRLRHQVWLVEDLVTGRVGDGHPLRALLAANGVGDEALRWYVDHAVQPDVYGINYYPRHSTELLEAGVHHGGGFADPRPVRDDGVDGLRELLRESAARYGAPVMVSETCVTASVPERAAWLAESADAVRGLRAEGLDVVGYTWWPLFDMYEWTWRHSTAPREAHRLTMGLYELVETDDGLERRATALVDDFRREAVDPQEPRMTPDEGQPVLTAHLIADPANRIGTIDRRLFGGFVEHLGRHIYDGVYEPGHPSADVDGFRRDVIELVKELGVTTIRYPGGNFVSGFRWEDSVGPRDERPRRLDLAWHSTETNEVGLHEFADWLEKVGSELMLAVNLGTRGVAEALDLLEYANIPGGTTISDSRRANGREQPFDVRMWCLGNEMDGPWQLGHRSADDYGKLAAQTAKAMRQLDPELQLVVCGSSARDMPTFGSWERTVLEHTYDDVDFISCHAYYQEREGDRGSFLASGVDMDLFIEEVVAAADEVGDARGSEKRIQISFDEWNIWYLERYHEEDKATGIDNWPIAPRILEDRYSVLDAVVFGSLMISLLKHADRVTSASLAQLVNVIAPIMTEPGGPAWRQTTFFPFATTSRLARGEAVRLELEAPSYDTARFGTVPLVDAVATREPAGGASAVFLVNRSQDAAVTVTVDVRALGADSLVDASTLHDADPDAANTLEEPERIALQPNKTARLADGLLTIELPPISWTAVELAAK